MREPRTHRRARRIDRVLSTSTERSRPVNASHPHSAHAAGQNTLRDTLTTWMCGVGAIIAWTDRLKRPFTRWTVHIP